MDAKKEKRVMMGGLDCFPMAAPVRSGREEVISSIGLSFSLVGDGMIVKVNGSDSPVNQSESLLVDRVGGGCWVMSPLADGERS